MALVIINNTTLNEIANAIREKTGNSSSLLPSEFAAAIKSIDLTPTTIPNSTMVENSIVAIEDSTLLAIAEAIRLKLGETGDYLPSEMPDKIREIPTRAPQKVTETHTYAYNYTDTGWKRDPHDVVTPDMTGTRTILLSSIGVKADLSNLVSITIKATSYYYRWHKTNGIDYWGYQQTSKTLTVTPDQLSANKGIVSGDWSFSFNNGALSGYYYDNDEGRSRQPCFTEVTVTYYK